MQDQFLAGLEASFEIAAMEELAVEGAGRILHEQVIDRTVPAHIADRAAAGDPRPHGIYAAGLDLSDRGEADAVLVAERQIGQQVFDRAYAAFGQRRGALRAHPFEVAYVVSEQDGHRGPFISFSRTQVCAGQAKASAPAE